MLDSSKLKEFADDNFKFDENGRKFSKQLENTVGKEESARNEQFLLFPPCFQKACFPGASKSVIVWEWVNLLPHNAAFWHTKEIWLWKTLWEKEKLLATINFSFSHNVFYPIWHLFFILTHYQMTNFRFFRTERLCRRQFQIWQKWQKVIQAGRKHCGKRRNCSLRAISPFPTVFSKGLFPRGVKRRHCVGMG